MYAIETRGLTKYYGKARGILDVNLQVEEGDFFGFIGPNGAGKSTTIRTLLGLISPTAGERRALGLDCGKDRKKLLAGVGYMPSEAAFYGGMRVGEVISLAAGLRRADCRQEAKRLCERLELDTGKRVEELSLGNRKKVSIVCAMQHKPSLYILDEPTSGLDPLMQQEFFRLLRERNAEGATIFLSSHVLGEIQEHCRHAGIVREGRLIRVGTVESLRKGSARRVTVATAQGKESYLYKGEIRELIGRLAAQELTDLTITEPTLEEIVMHYYEGEEQE